ncbi:MAG: hypothetical protein HQL77_16730 [Magnetococcales bacterium]|nr:hypothetical protein [Magnetococcales bacterium]
MRIGFDLDNTLACYDASFMAAAKLKGWLSEDLSPATKSQVRQHIRHLPDGEHKWQELQAHVYGPGMGMATLMTGADRFIQTARKHKAFLTIVSHKTDYSPLDEQRRWPLREAARRWMAAQHFFHNTGLGFRPEHVCFTTTRQEKVQAITNLHLDLFVDDLLEVFLEPGFPHDHTRALLFDPGGLAANQTPIRRFTHWDAIHDWVFP